MFEKMNEYFGLDTHSDRTWFFGVFGVGGTLFLIDMAIAYIL
ncbi:DUF3961 domain-containing protein [Bacillus cereus]|nr:DUF3961 domain-containing protein [Bacillus cereus group sp. BfR-BA-01358]MDA1612207.1 DUF3961 domain-containing protein [Bacillus cereus]MDA2617921.1 DUF3961 domain-containing protein [Bacillus cereus]